MDHLKNSHEKHKDLLDFTHIDVNTKRMLYLEGFDSIFMLGTITIFACWKNSTNKETST